MSNLRKKQFIDRDFNFVPFYQEGQESEVFKGVFIGPLTKKTRKGLESYVRNFNRNWRSPYGEGYSCGHVHDCCGCLVRKYMRIELTNFGAKLYYSEIYNY